MFLILKQNYWHQDAHGSNVNAWALLLYTFSIYAGAAAGSRWTGLPGSSRGTVTAIQNNRRTPTAVQRRPTTGTTRQRATVTRCPAAASVTEPSWNAGSCWELQQSIFASKMAWKCRNSSSQASWDRPNNYGSTVCFRSWIFLLRFLCCFARYVNQSTTIQFVSLPVTQSTTAMLTNLLPSNSSSSSDNQCTAVK